MRRGYENGHMVIALHTGKLMVNLPPELGSPDVWAGGGVGVGCRPTTSLFHRQSVYRVQIVWS